jgi:hypothetical protein
MVPGLHIGLKVDFLLWGNNVPSVLNVFSTNQAVTTHYHLLLCGMRVSEKHVWSKQSVRNRRKQKITVRDISHFVHFIRTC